MEEASPTTRLITAEEGAVIVEELEATAPPVDQSYPDDIAIAVRSAITDADLFLSYNLPDKAIVPLLGALPQAPSDVRLNQRLAALHTRNLRFTEAAVCCRTLETSYHDAGFADEAVAYGELAIRYEERAAAAPLPQPVPASPPTASASVAAAAGASASPWPAPPPPAQEYGFASESAPDTQSEFSIEEPTHAPHGADDLSSEWAHAESSVAPSVPDQPSVEEPAPVAANAEDR